MTTEHHTDTAATGPRLLRSLPLGHADPASPFHVPADLHQLYCTVSIAPAAMQAAIAAEQDRRLEADQRERFERVRAHKEQTLSPERYATWARRSVRSDGSPTAWGLSDEAMKIHAWEKQEIARRAALGELGEDELRLLQHRTIVEHAELERSRRSAADQWRRKQAAREAEERARRTCEICETVHPETQALVVPGLSSQPRTCPGCTSLLPLAVAALDTVGAATRLEVIGQWLTDNGAATPDLGTRGGNIMRRLISRR